MFHGVASAVQLIGLAVTVFGIFRAVRARALADRRAATPAEQAPADRARYARGLTDFYRISGAVAILAGVILLLVPVFAG